MVTFVVIFFIPTLCEILLSFVDRYFCLIATMLTIIIWYVLDFIFFNIFTTWWFSFFLRFQIDSFCPSQSPYRNYLILPFFIKYELNIKIVYEIGGGCLLITQNATTSTKFNIALANPVSQDIFVWSSHHLQQLQQPNDVYPMCLNCVHEVYLIFWERLLVRDCFTPTSNKSPVALPSHATPSTTILHRHMSHVLTPNNTTPQRIRDATQQERNFEHTMSVASPAIIQTSPLHRYHPSLNTAHNYPCPLVLLVSAQRR